MKEEINIFSIGIVECSTWVLDSIGARPSKTSRI